MKNFYIAFDNTEISGNALVKYINFTGTYVKKRPKNYLYAYHICRAWYNGS